MPYGRELDRLLKKLDEAVESFRASRRLVAVLSFSLAVWRRLLAGGSPSAAVPSELVSKLPLS
jgi:hypothetical protein